MKKELLFFVLGVLLVVLSPAPASAAAYSIQVCPTWAVYPYDNGSGGTAYACGQFVNGEWQDLGEMIDYEAGFLPALSIADAQTILVRCLTVLAGVWGIVQIGRLIKRS